jgi:hypothetical protein
MAFRRGYRSLRASSVVLAARSAPEVCFVTLAFESEEDGAPIGAAVLLFHASFRTRGAYRRAVSASLRRRPRFRPAPLGAQAVSQLLAGGPSAPGRSPAPPGGVPLLRARPRAPTQSPRAGATGSCPSRGNRQRWVYGLIGRKSREGKNSGEIDARPGQGVNGHGTSGGHR